MSYEYAQKRRGTAAPGNESGGVSHAPQRSFPNSARLDALKSGAMRPTAADKGHRLELQAAMRAKMEQSFGADLSSVKLYESQTVADAGAEAVAQGNEIAFAPGKTDFSSQSGQALLGHELSHVVSQSRGEVTGGGFLADSGLEARADREGAMAARGETIYSGEMNGGAVAPLSTASATSMAGPMQASSGKKKGGKKKGKKASREAATERINPVMPENPIDVEDMDIDMGQLYAQSNDENSLQDEEAKIAYMRNIRAMARHAINNGGMDQMNRNASDAAGTKRFDLSPNAFKSKETGVAKAFDEYYNRQWTNSMKLKSENPKNLKKQLKAMEYMQRKKEGLLPKLSKKQMMNQYGTENPEKEYREVLKGFWDEKMDEEN